MKRIAAAAFALSLASTLHAEEIVWIKDGQHAASHELAPGKFVEVCAHIAPGERYRWNFDASGKVHFDIHYHIEELVGRPAVLESVQEASSLLEVRSKQDYCWTWRNRTKELIKVNAKVEKLSR